MDYSEFVNSIVEATPTLAAQRISELNGHIDLFFCCGVVCAVLCVILLVSAFVRYRKYGNKEFGLANYLWDDATENLIGIIFMGIGTLFCLCMIFNAQASINDLNQFPEREALEYYLK